MSDRKTAISGIFVALSMLYVTCLLTSNLIAGKIWALTDHITVPASVILFPVTYILADIYTEVYGFGRAKQVIWMGFICNFIAVITYVIMVDLPYPASWIDQNAYAVVFGFTPRVLAASFVAYLFGEFSNAVILSRLKVITKGKKLWLRTILSTMVGQGLDSVIFITISFMGIISIGHIVTMILYQYLFKLIFEVVFTPLTYLIVGKLKKAEGVDVYDTDEKYRLI
ncbi:MAG: queuosine precursor transporter [Lachnospiraceae bacterium]|nr:queuosine precursor transporter [Lachnospiraceae bacterium]